MNELNAYDNIGIQYYYLKNIEKAIYYHNRMMNGELEKFSLAKEANLNKLNNSRIAGSYKKSSIRNSIFEVYRDTKKLLHEDDNAMKILELKISRVQNKSLLISPRYKDSSIKERILKSALQKVLQNPAKNVDRLRGLNSKYVEINRRFQNTFMSAEDQYQLEQQKNALYSDLKVSSLAHKYEPCNTIE